MRRLFYKLQDWFYDLGYSPGFDMSLYSVLQFFAVSALVVTFLVTNSPVSALALAVVLGVSALTSSVRFRRNFIAAVLTTIELRKSAKAFYARNPSGSSIKRTRRAYRHQFAAIEGKGWGFLWLLFTGKLEARFVWTLKNSKEVNDVYIKVVDSSRVKGRSAVSHASFYGQQTEEEIATLFRQHEVSLRDAWRSMKATAPVLPPLLVELDSVEKKEDNSLSSALHGRVRAVTNAMMEEEQKANPVLANPTHASTRQLISALAKASEARTDPFRIKDYREAVTEAEKAIRSIKGEHARGGIPAKSEGYVPLFAPADGRSENRSASYSHPELSALGANLRQGVPADNMQDVLRLPF